MERRRAGKTSRLYKSSDALEVFYQDDDAPVLVGRLASTSRGLYFEYDNAWLSSAIELSPLKLPLKPGIVASRSPKRLHGLFADSLPGDWGSRVVDSELRRLGINPSAVGPLDRLAFLNDRSMGALRYEPPLAVLPQAKPTSDLSALATDSESLATEHSGESQPGVDRHTLEALLQAAGSAGGAQAKVLGGIRAADGAFISGVMPPSDYTPVIVKLTPSRYGFGLRADSGVLEEAYARMARSAKIDVAESRLLTTEDGGRHFATVRFDRTEKGGRRHVHTLGNLFDRDAVESTDYSELFAAARALTRTMSVAKDVFRRMYFNVCVFNDDDHSHNHAFILKRGPDGYEWALAPAYDVTFSPNVAGVRGLTVDGSDSPTWKSMQALALRQGVSRKQIIEIADEVDAALDDWNTYTDSAGVGASSASEVRDSMRARRRAVGR